MKFSELLIGAIGKSEIPLRFEPGAEEAVAGPVTELLRTWILSHEPDRSRSEFDDGQIALVKALIEELEDRRDIQGT
jgi:hypothetical protein